MKKKYKILLIGILVLTSIICLTGCPEIGIENCPSAQPNTQWLSDDGKVLMVSNEDAMCFGYVDYCGCKIPLAFYYSPRSHLTMHGVYDDLITNSPVDGWHCHHYYEDEFTVDTKYLPEYNNFFYGTNELIRFRKLDEDEKVDFNLSDYDETDYVNNIHVIASALNNDLYSEKDFEWHTKEYDSIIITIRLISNDVGRIVEVNPVSLSNEEFVLNIIDNNSQEFEVVYDRQANEVKKIS